MKPRPSGPPRGAQPPGHIPAGQRTGMTCRFFPSRTGPPQSAVLGRTGPPQSAVLGRTGAPQSAVLGRTGPPQSAVLGRTGAPQSAVLGRTGAPQSAVLGRTGAPQSAVLDLAQRLVLCALLGSVGASCPPRCACSEAAHTVKCVSRDLRRVPAGIPGYTRNLFITGNQIRRISPDSFRGLDNVTNLSLSNNRISEVESHSFAGLRSLRSLDLSNNQLAVIHPEAFTVQNQSLRELNLSRALYNRSSVMDLATALRWSSLGTLKGLDLSDNGLIYLPSRVFSHLTSLRRLQLSNNSLVAIHNSTFSGLERLEELDLTLNALKMVPEEGLRELDSLPSAALLLGENPFTCMCGIEPFALWLNRSQGRIRDAEGLVCSFPADMRNTSMLAVGTLTLGCQQRNAGADLALQTSYVFLGIVLGFVGLVFLFVLYLNRKGIKKRIYDMRDACREVWEGYHYHFEIDSGPRLSQVSTSADM